MPLGPRREGPTSCWSKRATPRATRRRTSCPCAWQPRKSLPGSGVGAQSHAEKAPGALVDASDDPRVAQVLLEVVRRSVWPARAASSAAFPPSSCASSRRGSLPLRARSVASRATRRSCTARSRRQARSAASRRARAWNSRRCGTSAPRGGAAVNVPALPATIELWRGRKNVSTLMIIQSYVPNRGDAWTYTIDEVQRYFERVLDRPPRGPPALPGGLLDLGRPQAAVGADRPGRRLPRRGAPARATYGGAAHALASGPTTATRLRPRVVTALAKRSFYQSVRNLASRCLSTCSRAQTTSSPTAAEATRAPCCAEREIRRASR